MERAAPAATTAQQSKGRRGCSCRRRGRKPQRAGKADRCGENQFARPCRALFAWQRRGRLWRGGGGRWKKPPKNAEPRRIESGGQSYQSGCGRAAQTFVKGKGRRQRKRNFRTLWRGGRVL